MTGAVSARVSSSFSVSFDKGTPVARPVRKARDLA